MNLPTTTALNIPKGRAPIHISTVPKKSLTVIFLMGKTSFKGVLLIRHATIAMPRKPNWITNVAKEPKKIPPIMLPAMSHTSVITNKITPFHGFHLA